MYPSTANPIHFWSPAQCIIGRKPNSHFKILQPKTSQKKLFMPKRPSQSPDVDLSTAPHSSSVHASGFDMHCVPVAPGDLLWQDFVSATVGYLLESWPQCSQAQSTAELRQSVACDLDAREQPKQPLVVLFCRGANKKAHRSRQCLHRSADLW